MNAEALIQEHLAMFFRVVEMKRHVFLLFSETLRQGAGMT